MNCIFCKIIKGELPSSIVLDDMNVFAILDIHPVSDGHTLILPRRHVESYTDLSPEEVAQIAQTGRIVAKHLKASISGCTGVTFSLADGVSAGQEVPHVHLHVIPRKSGDGFGWNFPPNYSTEAAPRNQLNKVAAIVKKSIYAK
jgi:histidine triad (HIT) family protein